MAFIGTGGISTCSGGSGTAYAWITQTFTQTSAFLSGLTLTLSQAPADVDAVMLDYNGRILSATEYSISGTTVTILFADPDVAFYDSPPYFQTKYPYIV
ncbi:MAG: hypothetical protein ACRC78_04140 [Planktothrix sp.]